MLAVACHRIQSSDVPPLTCTDAFASNSCLTARQAGRYSLKQRDPIPWPGAVQYRIGGQLAAPDRGLRVRGAVSPARYLRLTGQEVCKAGRNEDE